MVSTIIGVLVMVVAGAVWLRWAGHLAAWYVASGVIGVYVLVDPSAPAVAMLASVVCATLGVEADQWGEPDVCGGQAYGLSVLFGVLWAALLVREMLVWMW